MNGERTEILPVDPTGETPGLPTEPSLRLLLHRERRGIVAFAEGPVLLNDQPFRRAAIGEGDRLQLDELVLRELRIVPLRRRRRGLLWCVLVVAMGGLMAFAARRFSLPPEEAPIALESPPSLSAAPNAAPSKTFLEVEGEPEETARYALRRAEQLFASREVAPENRSGAWNALLQAEASFREGATERERSRLATLRRELANEFEALCARTLLAAQKQEAFGHPGEARAELRRGLRSFPDPGLPCHGRIVERLEGLDE